MIIRKIRFENFGLYEGRCEIDLTPRRTGGQTRPIVLIGGKNGSGKTTLLEGVRLALYGRRSLGTRVGQSEYDEYLRRHTRQTTPERRASVTLEFDYAEAGIVHRYQVQREWTLSDKRVNELLVLEKDGGVIAGVPRDEWQQFLQELIPPGVSQLFFFDGEKIREIADADENNEQLAEAIRGLLGIDLVERARTDLGLFLARAEQGKNADVSARLREVVDAIEQKDERIGELFEIVGELNTQRESQARAAEHTKQRFVAEGGDAAIHRSSLELERQEVERRLSACNARLREVANGLLPFAFAPRLLERFGISVKQANARQTLGTNAESVLLSLSEWRKSGTPKRNADWKTEHWTDLNRFIKSWAAKSRGRETRTDALLPGIDAAATLAKLSEVQHNVIPAASALCSEIDSLSERHADLETALARADNAAAGHLLDELRLLEQSVGATEATLRARQEELTSTQGQRVMLVRERDNLLDQQTSAALSSHRIELAGKVAQALVLFERRLLERKLQQLRGEFVRHFNFIARKDALISDIDIDPNTFAATLFDKAGTAVPKKSLSAGEQQVYAIAMLWALAKTSGRPLPMIIDTPLARLDSEHRENLLLRYFPKASHQVVLLSTDTEITDSLYTHLSPSVSHTFRLDYDEDNNRTIVTAGYFDTSTEKQRVLQQTQRLQ